MHGHELIEKGGVQWSYVPKCLYSHGIIKLNFGSSFWEGELEIQVPPGAPLPGLSYVLRCTLVKRFCCFLAIIMGLLWCVSIKYEIKV